MSPEIVSDLTSTLSAIRTLTRRMVDFWLENGIDKDSGGYFTCFDENGKPLEQPEKYLVTQTRMIWALAALSKAHSDSPVAGRRSDLLRAAEQGYEFLLKYFWDKERGGWNWKTRPNGTVLDAGKIVYGQSFAIYALCEYADATGNTQALEYADRTFDLLQRYAVDTYRGGYFENFEADWRLSAQGFAGGDRKTLDVHMHIMEALTPLARLTGKDVHRRKLEESIALIVDRMIDPASGAGRNHFDVFFNVIPAISIKRTWNAERSVGEAIDTPTDTTSYGHNIELSWLMGRALETAQLSPEVYEPVMRRLVDHALSHGFDHQLGGMYRDGTHDGDVLVSDKEWWQNAESLVGLLDAFQRFGDSEYLEAFLKLWRFAQQYFIDERTGEWHQLLDRVGRVVDGTIGNPWKGFYHTGRSMIECESRLKRITQDVAV